MPNRMNVPEADNTQTLAKILVLSFVGDYPESATELHKQIVEELQPDATLQSVRESLADLANNNFIHVAMKPDGTTIYWRE